MKQKPVSEIVQENTHLAGHVEWLTKGDILELKGTADGFRLLASILEAQADGLGTDPTLTHCSSTFTRAKFGNALVERGAFKQLNLHCHKEFGPKPTPPAE